MNVFPMEKEIKTREFGKVDRELFGIVHITVVKEVLDVLKRMKLDKYVVNQVHPRTPQETRDQRPA